MLQAILGLQARKVFKDLPEIWVLQALQGPQEPLAARVLPET